MDLFKLIFTILWLAHFFGVAFYFFSKMEIENGITNTWLNQKEPIGSLEIKDKYISSLYWAFVTMVTVGYGDFVPSNTYERIFCIAVTLVTSGAFAYAVNRIGYIL